MSRQRRPSSWSLTIFAYDWHEVAKSPWRMCHAHDKTPVAIRKVMAVNRSSTNRKLRLFLFASESFNAFSCPSLSFFFGTDLSNDRKGSIGVTRSSCRDSPSLIYWTACNKPTCQKKTKNRSAARRDSCSIPLNCIAPSTFVFLSFLSWLLQHVIRMSISLSIYVQCTKYTDKLLSHGTFIILEID